MSDEFSTEQEPLTLWLFPDMLKDKSGEDKELLFEFVEAKKVETKTSKEIPVVVLLGEAYIAPASGGEKTLIGTEFISSVWNLQPSKEFKQKFPSWKEIKGGTRMLLSPNGSRINVREAAHKLQS